MTHHSDEYQMAQSNSPPRPLCIKGVYSALERWGNDALADNGNSPLLEEASEGEKQVRDKIFPGGGQSL